MFHIIHISDLHFKEDLYLPRVVKALCDDLKNIHEVTPIDAIVFSGDAAAKGQTQIEQIEAILAKFVSFVRAAVGVEVPVIICPGNHDIDLSKKAFIYEPLFAGITSPDKASEFVKQANRTDTEPLWKHLSGFRSLARTIDQDAFTNHPLYYTKIITSNGIKVGFASLNSAWMTKGGGNADYGQLYVGEYVLDLARKELENVDFRIAIMHHPLDWLAPEEKAKIQRYLTLNFDAFICGHNHNNNADSLNSNIGNLFTSNTGCVYQSNEYFNGYSSLKIDASRKKWILNAREYYFQREVFDIATRFAKGGVWESDFASNSVGLQVLIPGEVVRAVNERANSLLLSFNSEIAPKSIGAMFVEPPLSKMSEKELFAKTKGSSVPVGAYESLASLGENKEAILFIGKRETGKSLLLHHIAVNCFQSFNKQAKIGVVVDLHVSKRFTEAALLEQSVEFCGGEIVRRDLVNILKAGEVVVCIDNIKIEDKKHIEVLNKFVASYPKVRYIFATSEELFDGLSGSYDLELGVDISKIFVHSFRARHTKELVKKWFGSNDLTLKKRIEDINLLLDRLRVPRTPFLVSILSWVLEQQPNASVVNKASAIEVLIEGLLGKFHESKSRKGIDSTIQQHFLKEFALHLNNLDRDWIERLDFDGFVIDYFKNRGLNVATEGFAIDLIRRGLLFATDDRAGFKFDCFRAFFLAKKFAESSELWQDALRAETVSRYATEFDLFTGLHRDRIEVLRKAKELCAKTFAALAIDFPLDQIDQLSMQSVLINNRFLNHVENELLVEEKLDDETHHETPDIISVDHEESRKRKQLTDMGEVGRYLESLRVFSMILRNSELINDIELKRECFDVALVQWANTSNMVIRDIIEDDDEIEPINLENDLTKKNIKVAFSKAMVTQMILAVMCESLGTPKLELFIREKANDSRTLVRLLAVALAFHAGDDNAIQMGKTLLKDSQNNGFVLEVLFFKILSIFLYNGRDDPNPKLRDFLGDVVVQLRGGAAKHAAAMKSNFLAQIDKNLLIKDLNIGN